MTDKRDGVSATSNIGAAIVREEAKDGRPLFRGVSFREKEDDDDASEPPLLAFRFLGALVTDDAATLTDGKIFPFSSATFTLAGLDLAIVGAFTSRNSEVMFDSLDPKWLPT